MNPHRVKIFYGTDNSDIVFAITKQLKLIFFPTQNGLLYQYFMYGATFQPILQCAIKFFFL